MSEDCDAELFSNLQLYFTAHYFFLLGCGNGSITLGPPVWSPDSQQIAFSIIKGENWDIYVAQADGQNLTRLTNHPKRDSDPSWSSDSQQIIFVSHRDRNDVDFENLICLIDSDGLGLVKMDHRGSFPRWSPEGNKIAFVDEINLFAINSDGSGLIQSINWQVYFANKSSIFPQWMLRLPRSLLYF